MILCIGLISIGGSTTKGETVGLYLFLAVFFAFMIGAIFAMDAVHIYYVINNKVNID